MTRKLAAKKTFSGKTLADIDVKHPEQQAVQDDTRSLQERAMLVRSTISRWYGTANDEEVVAEIRQSKEAKGEIGSFTKRLMTRDKFSKISSITNEARKFHKQMTLPWGDSGARLLNVTQFFEYKRKMSGFERDFYIAVEAFLEQYQHAVAEQKERLGKMWRESDYPSLEVMRQRFRFAVLVEPLPSSDDFRIKLSKDEALEIRAEYEAEVKARLKAAVKEVFERVQETVGDLQGKLADPDAQIRSTTFEPLRKLVASLPQLNAVVQDPNIASLGNSIAKELLALDPGAVKDDKAVRSEAKKKADNILAALKPLRNQWNAQQPEKGEEV